MSLLPLANLLNESARAGKALITESEAKVSVSQLHSGIVKRLIAELTAISCKFQIYDQAFNECEPDEIDDGDSGYLVKFNKPIEELVRPNTLFILTETGLADHLRSGHPAVVWRIIGLSRPIYCKARALGNWQQELTAVAPISTKTPRLLVKEAANVRLVPENVQLWLLDEIRMLDPADPLHVLWVQFAHEALSRCIPNEVEDLGKQLLFKGPPKLTLAVAGDDPITRPQVSLADFDLLHEPASWVYENSREAEIKHVLLSTEIARSGRSSGDVNEYFRENLGAAFECAKIAYQMSISEVTKDTLKSLGDLRKAVTEETTKATDATRQIVAAIASALAIGLGMIVARMSVALSPWLILLVMVVALGYVTLIAMSGWHFIGVQRSLRTQWQLKLYRFLSAEDYKEMVTQPVGASERVYKWSALGGCGLLLAASISIVVFAFVNGNGGAGPARNSAPTAPKTAPRPDLSIPDGPGSTCLQFPTQLSA